MAPKSKSRFVDHPPSVSSSEEEQEQVEDSQEEEESGEEESGEETEEEARPSVKKPIVPKSPQTQQSSSEGSGSDAESDSGQSQPSPPSVSIKPSSKSKLPAKRPQEAQKESKKKKKPKTAQEEEEKKSAAVTPGRLWSDEDQLAVLRGMVEFKAQNPNADMSVFHDFVKGKLQEEGVTKSRLREKIRGLKKKFMPYMNSSEKPSFARTVDNTMFELAKKIWGGVKDDPSNVVVVKENANGKPKKTSGEPKKSSKVTKPKEDLNVKEDGKAKDDEKQVAAAKKVVKEDVVKERGDEFRSKYPHLAAAFNPAYMSLRYPEDTSLIQSDKAKVLEEKMKKLHQEETGLMIKRLGLMKEYYELLADANRGN